MKSYLNKLDTIGRRRWSQMAFHFGENGMTEDAEVSLEVLKWRGFFKDSLYKVSKTWILYFLSISWLFNWGL